MNTDVREQHNDSQYNHQHYNHCIYNDQHYNDQHNNHMENNIILGEASGTDANAIIEWECPYTGQHMSCQGEFSYNELGYLHDVYDQDDKYLYTVIAKPTDK